MPAANPNRSAAHFAPARSGRRRAPAAISARCRPRDRSRDRSHCFRRCARRAPAAGACMPDSRANGRATCRHWDPRRRRAAASSVQGRGWLPRRHRASRADSAGRARSAIAGGQRLWMCWLTSAPAAISNCALRCRRSRNSSTRSRPECATAKSGGNRSGPPGRLTHDGSACVACRSARSSPIAQAR